MNEQSEQCIIDNCWYCGCQVAIAMFGYMTEIDTVEMTDTQEIEAEGELWYALMTSYLFDSINLIN